MSRTRIAALPALLLLIVAAGAATGQTLPPPENVVNLSASAAVDVAQDQIAIVFSTTREGPEAATVQAQLRQALDQALGEARKAARPGAVDVRTGNFSLQPRYTPKGTTNGWTGSAELIVEGRDTAAVAQLAGRIQSLTIARVDHSLSREALEKVQGEVTAQAVARFRANADASARLFGFTGYKLREVSVGVGEPPGQPQPMYRARAAMADESLPVAAGKATVSATVNGSVQLTR